MNSNLLYRPHPGLPLLYQHQAAAAAAAAANAGPGQPAGGPAAAVAEEVARHAANLGLHKPWSPFLSHLHHHAAAAAATTMTPSGNSSSPGSTNGSTNGSNGASPGAQPSSTTNPNSNIPFDYSSSSFSPSVPFPLLAPLGFPHLDFASAMRLQSSFFNNNGNLYPSFSPHLKTFFVSPFNKELTYHHHLATNEALNMIDGAEDDFGPNNTHSMTTTPDKSVTDTNHKEEEMNNITTTSNSSINSITSLSSSKSSNLSKPTISEMSETKLSVGEPLTTTSPPLASTVVPSSLSSPSSSSATMVDQSL